VANGSQFDDPAALSGVLTAVYDWIDNAGRTSPRVLTPGLDRLAVAQCFGVGTLADFAPDDHITIRALPAAETWFGLVA
jgi:hypothetical protein